MVPGWLRDAAVLADTHGLTFYDASWAAAAAALSIPLASADGQLLTNGLAEGPSAVTTRLRLAT
jgi:predicted nucleic acid-binding protein